MRQPIYFLLLMMGWGICLYSCQSDTQGETDTTVQASQSTLASAKNFVPEEKETAQEMEGAGMSEAEMETQKPTSMPTTEIRAEVKELLKEELKVDEKQHFKQVENLFKEITDKKKTRPEKRLIQNKLEGYFSSPSDKVIEFTNKVGEKEQLSFHDFTRKVRVVSMDIGVENIALTESNLVNRIVIKEK